MINNKTIIISCAGMGKRLGYGIPKALVEIDGKPILIRILEQLDDVEDIRIVVGYQAESVIKKALSYRKDITFVFNQNYAINGTGASVSLAAKYAREFILTIDGDTIIHPDDMKKLLKLNEEFIAGTEISTETPVFIQTNGGLAVSFSRQSGNYEWTGCACIKSDRLIPGNNNTYELLETLLPIKHQIIRMKEIDTQNDYDVAERWIKNNYSERVTIGIVGGMGSYATAAFFKKILDSFPAEKEWERPRIIIDNYCTMPSRVRAILCNEKREELVDDLTYSISNLIGVGANKIILACNTSHVFLQEIYKKLPTAKKYIVNIIDECFSMLKANNITTAELMASEGTISARVFDRSNCNIINPNSKRQIEIREFIEAVKQDKITDDIIQKFISYINNSKNQNIILGCTELPVLYDLCKTKITKTVIDPLECAIGAIQKVI